MLKKIARPRGTDEAEVIQVIHTKALVGTGEEGDMVRYLHQYWSFNGELLATYDPLLEYDPMTVYDTRKYSNRVNEGGECLPSLQKGV